MEVQFQTTMEWGNDADDMPVSFTFNYYPGEPASNDCPGAGPGLDGVTASNEHGTEIEMTREMLIDAERACWNHIESLGDDCSICSRRAPGCGRRHSCDV